jgi:hypothetical protein
MLAIKRADNGEWVLPVAWLDSAQVMERMAEVFSIRLIDALETDEPRIRTHDGQHLRALP